MRRVPTQNRRGRSRRRVYVALILAGTLVATTSYFSSSLAFGAGGKYPSGCDPDVDIYRNPYSEGNPLSLWGTCWTRRYTPGYTASGLTAWAQASIDGEGFTLTVDGYFGPTTESKVKSWQSARGISSDGIVGNNSWIRMDEFGGVRAWSKVGSCGSQVSGVQFLKNEASNPDYALRPCLGAINGVPNGSYCLQVDTSWFYIRADRLDPIHWPDDDCLPIS